MTKLRQSLSRNRSKKPARDETLRLIRKRLAQRDQLRHSAFQKQSRFNMLSSHVDMKVEVAPSRGVGGVGENDVVGTNQDALVYNFILT